MGKRRWRRLDREVRRKIIRLSAQGLTYHEIHEQLDVPVGSLSGVLSPLGGVLRREQWTCSSYRLSLDERIEIYLGLELGRRELARCLRTGRAQRRRQGRHDTHGRLPGMILISERPAEIEDRAVPGHWEGDLLMGANNRSAIATLVERSTRYVLLGRIRDQRAETVREALTSLILRLPEHLRRSLTWDQGKEMAQHLRFQVDTGVAVYFCDPHSPWQRGSNENTNGLLRQYFPKGTSLARHTQDELDAVAASLNNRPRQTLNWMKPSEKLTELLAMTG